MPSSVVKDWNLVMDDFQGNSVRSKEVSLKSRDSEEQGERTKSIGCRNFRCFGNERGEENRRAPGKDKKIK